MKLATLVIQLAYYLSLTAIDHLDTKCNLVHPRGREKIIIFFVIKTSPLFPIQRLEEHVSYPAMAFHPPPTGALLSGLLS